METSSQMENSKTNQTLCTSLQSYVSDIHTPQHLYPSEYLTDKMGHTVMKTVAASALRLALKSEGGSSDVHFIIEEMSGDINKWPTIVEWVRKRLVEQIKTAFNGNVDLSYLVHRAMSEIIKKVNFMFGGISNEAELRYCVGDPILDALCDAWGYKAKLEETVKDHHLPGQHTTSTTPTRDSRADYTVYVIKRRDHPVAVLIEAKHKTHKVVKHALAQVTGYFAAFDILKTIPLVFVLTDVHIQVIIYPFKNGNGDALINGIVLPPFPLFNDDGVPKTLTLGMVLTLANYPEVETLIQLPDGCPSMSRVALGGIVLTEQQAELAKHEAEIRQYREEIRQLREQLKGLEITRSTNKAKKELYHRAPKNTNSSSSTIISATSYISTSISATSSYIVWLNHPELM